MLSCAKDGDYSFEDRTYKLHLFNKINIEAVSKYFKSKGIYCKETATWCGLEDGYSNYRIIYKWDKPFLVKDDEEEGN